jgi:MFS family permease
MKKGDMRGARKMPRSISMKRINLVVKLLTISDIMMMGAVALLSPVFAIFITDTIKGGSIEVVGIAMAIYAVTKSIFQMPIAWFIDKIKGEKDDFWFMFVGSFLSAIIPILYIFVKTPSELYLVQFIYGLIIAATFPTWLAIFTRHIDKEREGTEWAIYQTMVDFSTAIFAFLGGFLAMRFGFKNLFLLTAACNFIGAVFLIGVYKKMKPGKLFFK